MADGVRADQCIDSALPLYWLPGTSVRRKRRILPTDVPGSQYRRRSSPVVACRECRGSAPRCLPPGSQCCPATIACRAAIPETRPSADDIRATFQASRRDRALLACRSARQERAPEVCVSRPIHTARQLFSKRATCRKRSPQDMIRGNLTRALPIFTKSSRLPSLKRRG